MRDQDVITQLVELHDHIQPPVIPVAEDVLRGERLVRRRRTVSVAAVAAAVVLAVGVVQVSLPDGQRELQPAPAPSLPSPSESAAPSPDNGDAFAAEFRTIVARVPGWSIADTDPTLDIAPCAGDWLSETTGSGGGNFDVSTNGRPGQVWHVLRGFPSAASAADAVDRLVGNLASCETAAWQAEPIARTGAVLVSSADGLMWVQRSGDGLSTLEVATTDGPPPLDVQVEIADLMRSDSE